MIECHFCEETVASIEEAVASGWQIKFVVEGKRYDTPLCPQCLMAYRLLAEHGVKVPLWDCEPSEFEESLLELIADDKMRSVFDQDQKQIVFFFPE